MDIQRYSFRLSFFNELAAVDEHFQLFYYVRRDGRDEIEASATLLSSWMTRTRGNRSSHQQQIIYATPLQINDVKHKKKFLSRVHYPALKLSDIVIDGKVTV